MLGASTLPILRYLRIDTVQRLGYVNLRCSHHPGCTKPIPVFSPTTKDIPANVKQLRGHFADIYMDVFNSTPTTTPSHIANVCCAQFAVSRDRIRARPLSEYERMRDMIMSTSPNAFPHFSASLSAADTYSVGWAFEKFWHIIFGMEAVYCPSVEDCQCDVFGWCEGVQAPAGFGELRRGAHPWFGRILGGSVFGWDHAVGDDGGLD